MEKEVCYRYKMAMNAMKQGIWELVMPGDELFICPVVYEILGYTPYEFPSTLEAWKERVHPDDQNRDLSSEKIFENNREYFESVFRMRNCRNQWLWIRGRGGVFERSPSGEPLRIIAAISDFTYKKNANLVLQKFYRSLYLSAYTDHLTGLLNRQKIYSILEEEMERASRYSSTFSLIMMDIDRFKELNDTFGHLEGDRVLVQLAELIQGRVRKTDKVARWGGDEFMLLILADRESSIALAEDLRVTVQSNDFKIPFPLTVSIGIGSYRSEDDKNTLIARADKALFEAKSKGRNAVVSNF